MPRHHDLAPPNPASARLAVAPVAPLPAAPPQIVIDIHAQQIPHFVAAELERLYQNVYTTVARYRIYADLAGASTYVQRHDGRITALLLFRLERHTIRVLNQQIALADADIARFAAAVFARYQGARGIAFYALEGRVRQLALPHRDYWALEDLVLRLPASAAQYQADLGQSARYKLRRSERKLRDAFPSFDYAWLPAGAASTDDIAAIVALAGARAALKGQPAYLGPRDTERIAALAGHYGLVGVARIDGRICAGQVCYRVGANYFMHLIAHDPRYDAYQLGSIIFSLTVQACIADGGGECRFMAGGNDYKARFGALPLPLHSLLVYRNRWHYWLAPAQTSAALRQGWRRLQLALRGHAVTALLQRLRRHWRRRTPT